MAERKEAAKKLKKQVKHKKSKTTEMKKNDDTEAQATISERYEKPVSSETHVEEVVLKEETKEKPKEVVPEKEKEKNPELVKEKR